MTGSLVLLKQRRFLPLFATQFLNAFNDNFYKMAMVILATFTIYKDPETEAWFNALAGGLFILPFFLFSALAGQLADSTDNVVVSGERNLLGVQDFGHDLGSLRRLFDVFEQKTELMRLLDTSSRAEGVRIYIGGESQVVPFEELSVVTAPYEVDGRVVGTLGVIGPTRMAYDRMIQIVDITSKLVGNALSVK